MNLKAALQEYDTIVKAVKGDYTKEELTITALRVDHPELNFMDNEELEDIIKYANGGRSGENE